MYLPPWCLPKQIAISGSIKLGTNLLRPCVILSKTHSINFVFFFGGRRDSTKDCMFRVRK